MVSGAEGCITDVPGIRVGHWSDLDAATGCSVVIAEHGATGAVASRGPYPASRELAFLAPPATAVDVHAVLLTGGSTFGLDASGGVARYLEERGRGARVGPFVTPRVPTAAIFDLGLGRGDLRPTAESGYLACIASEDGGQALTGTVGVGTGATAGKLLGARRATKGGFGTASVRLDQGIVVGAAAVTNSLGGIHDPSDGTILAGPRANDGFVDSVAAVLADDYRPPRWMVGTNTTLAVLATNAPLSQVGATRLAEQAHDALALAVRPVHTEFDGDTVFCLCTRPSGQAAEALRLGAAAVRATVAAVLGSVRCATGLHGVPALRDLTASHEVVR